MSTINAANLELKLTQKINSTTAPLELLALGTALRQLQNGAVFVVQQFSQLPSASANLGQLYFVIDDGIVYVSAPDTLGVTLWKTLASDSISQVFTWGINNSGQLGDGTLICRSSPGNVSGEGTTWCQISTGDATTTALKTDGTAWTWGRNQFGQLGDGTVAARCSPGTVSGGGTTWCQISAGFTHTAAVKTDGTAWTWGYNVQGQLGNNSTGARCSPGTTSGGGTTWCQISASYHTAAIKTDGTVWTWGLNNVGQLGNCSVVNRSSPGTVCGGGTTWCQISTGSIHTAAIKMDGTAWTWGGGSSGQLGNNTAVPRSSPGTLSGGGNNWCQISAGTSHSAATDLNGLAWSWGNNSSGQLGNGCVAGRSSPGLLAGGGSTWCEISAGNSHSAAVKTDGTAWTWGLNHCGQLGSGTVAPRSSPGTVLGGTIPWCQISAGYHTAAIASKTL
jgi:alpha-tubulin suppressor-like RCC1 family protein